MSREKFVTLCIDKLEPETAKTVLKVIAEEMPVAEECLYQMFRDEESRVLEQLSSVPKEQLVSMK